MYCKICDKEHSEDRGLCGLCIKSLIDAFTDVDVKALAERIGNQVEYITYDGRIERAVATSEPYMLPSPRHDIVLEVDRGLNQLLVWHSNLKRWEEVIIRIPRKVKEVVPE